MTPTYLYTDRSPVNIHPGPDLGTTSTNRPLPARCRRGRTTPNLPRRSPHGRIHLRPARAVAPPTPKDPSREVPRRARRARRCRRLGCPQPPGPSQRPGPGRPADRGRATRAWCSRRSTTRPPPAPPSPPRSADEGRALVSGRLLADICRSLPAKPVEMVLDGSRVSLTCGSARFSLQTMPVEDYPALPDMPAATGTVAERRRSPTPSPRRSPPPAATTCCRCSPASGSRSTARRSRCSPPTGSGSRTASSTGTRAPPTSRWPRWCPAKVLGDTAKSLTAGSEVTIALAATGTGEGIIGFEGAAPGGIRRTTTRLLDGEFPKVRSLFPQRAPDHGPGRQGRADRVGQARRAGRRAQHRRPARVHRRRADPRRRLRRRGAGLGVDRGHHRRRGHHHRASTRSSCSTASTAIDEAVVELAFTQASKPVVISGSTDGEDGDDVAVPLPADAAPPALLTPPTSRRTRAAAGLAWTSDSSASARWAATCAPACATPATPSSATTATRTSPTSDSLAEMVEQLPSPKVVWVMVPAGDPTRETIKELGELLGEGDLVVDGGNSKWTDDQRERRAARREGHRLRRLRRLRRRLGPRRTATR